MGQAKKEMTENEEKYLMEIDYKDFFKELLDRDELIDPLKGIAKQLISKGYASLSEAQRKVVTKYIDGFKSKHVCERCCNGNVSTLKDYLFVADNGICPMCKYDEERFMED